MNLFSQAKARARDRHEPPWADGELPRIGVQARALARRDRRVWWKVQRREGRRLLKQVQP